LLSATAAFHTLVHAQEKMKMNNSISPHWRGYISLGCENTQGQPDWREQVEFGVEQQPLDSALEMVMACIHIRTILIQILPTLCQCLGIHI